VSAGAEVSPQADPDGHVSASTLLFLFADRFVPVMTWRQRWVGMLNAVAAPASGVLLPLGVLETRMAAVALWSLEDRGLVRTALGEWETHGWDYVLWFSLRNDSPTPRGLETVLLNAMQAERCTVHQLVAMGSWFGPHSLPINGLIVPAQREVLSHGLLRREPRGRRLPRCLRWCESLPDYVGVADRIAELEEFFGDLDNRLGAWCEAHRFKWNTLMTECSRAVGQARPNAPFPSTSLR
jgi:hypothetical protein